jgi:hypothetical protein
VILIGQDFRGQRLAVVSTGFAMAYAAGSIVGSTPVGYLIDIFGPEALPISVAFGFLGLTVFLLVRKPEKQPSSSVVQVFDDLPEIVFDLSFLKTPEIKFDLSFLDEREPVHVEKAKVGDLQVRNDNQRQERDLEEGFRQRAAEVARRAAQRYQSGVHGFERLETYQTG